MAESDIALPEGCSQVYSNAQINDSLLSLAARLNQQLAGEEVLALCVMQGGLVFSGQLIPYLDFMVEIDYIHITRYENETQGGQISWKSYPQSSLEGRTVLILDDILDEGKTLKAIIDYCHSQGVRKVVSAVLLMKMHDRNDDLPEITASLHDNFALTVDDHYVFGFGMDLHGKYRQLDSIYALSEECQ